MDNNYNNEFQMNNYVSNSGLNTFSKKNKNKLLIIVAIIFIIGCLIFVGCKFLFKDKSELMEFDINVTTSFFLQNQDAKYALFNEDGKQLTEFIYTHASSFVNGTTKVEVDNQEGIIDANGKMTVPLGKYKYITSRGGLYSVWEDTEESYNKYLINGSGKILYDLDEIEINYYWGVDTFLILEFEKENKYTVINYQGKELVSFPKIDDDEVKEPSVNEENEYISIFYNNKNWIFNVNTGKQLTSFDSELHYCVNNVSDDGSIVTLNSCVGWYQSQDKTYYKFIKDGKLYDKTNECDKLRLNSGNLFCTKDSDEYLLDENLNVGIKTYGKAYSNESNSYVMDSTTNDYTVEFYQNGKIIKTVSCRDLKETGYMNSNIYLLGTHYNKACGTNYGQYEYYNQTGEKIVNKTFAKASNFDSNGLAQVSEDKINYYMIDTTGNQVGNAYSNIYLYAGYYIVTNNNLKGVMNKEGKEIIAPAYSTVDIFTKKDKVFVVLKTAENKYIVYDLNKDKELFTVETKPNTIYEHYITTSLNGKTQYYTFDGKMFYEN